jgi:hypothetical protein
MMQEMVSPPVPAVKPEDEMVELWKFRIRPWSKKVKLTDKIIDFVTN